MRGNCTVDEAITAFVNQKVTSFVVVNRRKVGVYFLLPLPLLLLVVGHGVPALRGPSCPKPSLLFFFSSRHWSCDEHRSENKLQQQKRAVPCKIGGPVEPSTPFHFANSRPGALCFCASCSLVLLISISKRRFSQVGLVHGPLSHVPVCSLEKTARYYN